MDAITTLRQPMVFVSGDNDLLAAASAEGYVTDNPYLCTHDVAIWEKVL